MRKAFKVLIFSLLLISVFFLGNNLQPLIQLVAPKSIGRLNVSIRPENVTLTKGESETFYALVLNGTGKYSYEWKVNGSIVWNEALFEFRFDEVCECIILSVSVVDSDGNWGYDSAIVYDPVATGSYYLDTPLPLYTHYIGQYSNESSFAINGTNWDNFLVNENASYVLNSVSDVTTSGTIFVGAGNYNMTAYVKLKNNVSWETVPFQARLYLGLVNVETVQRSNIFYSESNDLENITIRGFELDGQTDWTQYSASSHLWNGIYFQSQARHILIEYNHVHHFRRYGIKVRASTGKLSYDCIARFNRVHHIGYDGIIFNLYNGVGGDNFYLGEISSNQVWECGDIHVGVGMGQLGAEVGNLTQITISNNVIGPSSNEYGTAGVATWYGIRLEDGAYCSITGNSIYGCRIGISDIDTGDGHNTIMGNTIRLKQANATDSNYYVIGIEIYTDHNEIIGNTIWGSLNETWTGLKACQGTEDGADYNTFAYNTLGVVEGALEDGWGIHEEANCDYNSWLFNDLVEMDTKVKNFLGTGAIVEGNKGYNPVGYDATPVLSGNIRDTLGTGAIQNDTVYNIVESPKNIYVSGGTVFAIKIDGQTVFTDTDVMVHVVSGQTFEVEHDSATIKSFSE